MTSSRPKVLIVDDEPDIRDLLGMTLEDMGMECLPAADVATAREALAGHSVQLCLTDLRMPREDGLVLVRHIQQQYPQVPVAVITAHGTVDSAIEAMKAGAFDFVSKPIKLPQLRALVNSGIKLAATPAERPTTTELLGDTEVIRKLREDIRKIARTQAPVMISGESGTGKELVARLIHASSHRSDNPFVPVNCGAIPSELMESEFFGYRKGSFTGAASDRTGLFEAARGGTLFLDEIAELPLNMQVKLLRALQEKAIRPLGESREVPIDVRIVCASNRDVANLVQQELFRSDLFYRINVVQIAVPSLRERSEDIPQLVDNILARLRDQWNIAVPTLTPAAMARLQAYHFPGNVRELENILERAVTLAEHEVIDAGDLQLRQRTTDNGPTPGVSEPAQAPLPDRPADIPTDLTAYLDKLERDILERALVRSRWNMTEAARAVGLSFRQMRYRLKKHKL